MGLSLLQSLGSLAGGASRGMSRGDDIFLSREKMKLAQQVDDQRKQDEQAKQRLAAWKDLVGKTQKAIEGITEERASYQDQEGEQIGPPESAEIQKQAELKKSGLVKSAAEIGVMFKDDPIVSASIEQDIRNLMGVETGYAKKIRELEEKRQEEMMKLKVKEELKSKEEKTLTSDLLDASGNVKNEVSSSIRSEVMSDFALLDPITGESRRNLTTAEQKVVQHRKTIAEKLIKNKEANGVIQAVEMARAAVPFDGESFVPLPQKTKDEMLAQNQEIDRLLAKQDQVLKDSLKGTGIESTVPAFFDATLGQVIGLFMDEGFSFSEGNQQARQGLRLFNQDVKRSIVNSQRFPKWEQEIIVDMLPSPEQISKNPKAAYIQAKMLFDYLKNRKAENLERLGMKKIESSDQDKLQKQVDDILNRNQ